MSYLLSILILSVIVSIAFEIAEEWIDYLENKKRK